MKSIMPESANTFLTEYPINGYYMNELAASVLYQYTRSAAPKDVALIAIGEPQYPPDENECI